MIGICEDLRKSVLQAAIQGRLTKQFSEDGDAETLYAEIQKKKQKLINEGKIKNEKPLSEITEDDIPFDIPENWKWVRLGTVIKLQSGQDFEPSGYNDKGQGIPYLTGASNLENGNVIINRWTTCPRCVVKGGTLLIVCKGAGVGKMAFLKIQEAHIARQLMGITTYSTSLEYVKILLDKNVNDIRMNMQGIIPGISREDILNILFPLPPLAEQKRIVARVDELMAKIDGMEKTEKDIIALYDAFPGDMKASFLQAAIQGKLTEQLASDGDAETLYQDIQKEKQRLIKEGKIKKEKPLPEITDDDIPFDIPENWKWVYLNDITIKTIKRGKSPHYATKSNTLVFAQKCNTKAGYIDTGLSLYLDETYLKSYPISEFLTDYDVVINSTGGGTLGRVGIYRDSDNPRKLPIVPDSHVTVIRSINSTIQQYLYHVLKFMQPELETMGAGSTNQTELRPDTVKALYIPLPSISEQKCIVEKLDQLLPLCDSMKEAIDA